MVKTLNFQWSVAWVQSLVKKLRFNMPPGTSVHTDTHTQELDAGRYNIYSKCSMSDIY